MTINFYFPKSYKNTIDATKSVGRIIREDEKKHVLILTSKTSFTVVKENLLKGFSDEEIDYQIEYFSGYPSKLASQKIVEKYEYKEFDLILGVGGGRVFDLAKIVASSLKLPIYGVPTIAATCASWAKVSILYDESGAFTGSFFNQEGVQKIIADTKILLEAPEKYINAGVLDTFAKWYEIAPYVDLEEDTSLILMSDIAKKALLILKENAPIAIKAAKEGVIGVEASLTIDSIIYLAGFTGSLRSGKLYHGIAHTFYNASTQVGAKSTLLHGEKVAFGLLLQQVLIEDKFIDLQQTLDLFSSFNGLYTFKELGLEREPDKIILLAEKMYQVIEKEFAFLGYAKSAKDIEKALYQTNELIENYKQSI